MSRYYLYEQAKKHWLIANPTATPQEVQDAFARIARKLGL
jgi:t-SNARE complex subunit (syntaxin)